MSHELLQRLESQIDELLRVCTRLEKENALLLQEKETWNLERARLIEKNNFARKRVEAMIAHLKTIEPES